VAFLLENAFNGSAMVEDAGNHPLVRLFTSKKNSSPVPLLEQPQVEEQWAVSSKNATTDDGCPHCNGSTPDAVGAALRDGTEDDNWLYMSAVCYIFGKNIQAHTGKPVGLVNTNWGGKTHDCRHLVAFFPECNNRLEPHAQGPPSSSGCPTRPRPAARTAAPRRRVPAALTTA